jgi:hypothetical protein
MLTHTQNGGFSFFFFPHPLPFLSVRHVLLFSNIQVKQLALEKENRGYTEGVGEVFNSFNSGVLVTCFYT